MVRGLLSAATMIALRLFASASLVTTLGALALACSSDPGAGGTEGACAQYASAYREYTAKCTTQAGASRSDSRWQQLEDRMRLACASSLSLPGTGLTPAGISVCANAVRNASCTLDSDDLPQCDFPNGTLADGAACNSGEQCKSGACTKMSSGTGSSACGVCAARVAIGGDCSTNPRCVEDATCSSTSKTCVAMIRNGVGGSCDGAKYEYCQSGLYCESATKICKERLPAGAACTSSTPCQSGLTCNATSKTCVAPTSVGEGQTCGGTTFIRCASGLACEPTSSKCVKITWVAPLGDCSAFGSQCEHGSCSSTTKKCPALIADGQPCTSDRATGVCNDFASCIDGKCQLPGTTVCK